MHVHRHSRGAHAHTVASCYYSATCIRGTPTGNQGGRVSINSSERRMPCATARADAHIHDAPSLYAHIHKPPAPICASSAVDSGACAQCHIRMRRYAPRAFRPRDFMTEAHMHLHTDLRTSCPTCRAHPANPPHARGCAIPDSTQARRAAAAHRLFGFPSSHLRLPSCAVFLVCVCVVWCCLDITSTTKDVVPCTLDHVLFHCSSDCSLCLQLCLLLGLRAWPRIVLLQGPKSTHTHTQCMSLWYTYVVKTKLRND